MKAVNWFKNLGIVKKALVVIAAFFIGMVVIAAMTSPATPEGSAQTAQEATQHEEKEEQVQKDTEAENAPQEAVQAESSDPLADLAGATNVEGTNVEWIGGNEGELLKVTFPVHDNFGAEMIRTGAQKDTMSILRAVKESNIEYERVFIHGTFPMVDKFGNETQGIPLTAQYLPETVNAINYDEILVQEGIWDLADMHKADPDLFGTN